MSENAINLRPLRVAVLLGGESTEREISLKSGAAVSMALESRGHRVTRIDPAETELSSIDWPKFDAAFLALHGRFGEDGQVQSLFDSWSVAYTGSSAAASRLAFSKSAAKERFAACGVPTPSYVLIHESDSPSDLRRVAEQIGYPLVMKPDSSGSSLGVTIVSSQDELPAAAEACFSEGPFGLAEEAIAGSEWTLGLMDDQPLPLIRIDSQRGFFDFSAKYDDDRTVYRFDIELPASTRRKIEIVGSAAAMAVGTSGIARVDLRLDESGNPWVLEVNTVPGFTDHSLVPKAAAQIGVSLGELCERSLVRCLETDQQRRQNGNNGSTPTETEPLRYAG